MNNLSKYIQLVCQTELCFSGCMEANENNRTCVPPTLCLVNNIVGCVVNVIFLLSGISMNGLVLICFWKSRLRSKLPYFLINVLSCVDLITVATIHPLFLFYWAQQLPSSYGRREWSLRNPGFFAAFFISGLSGLTLAVMNIERYLAIVYPYFYERSVTKRRLLITVLIFYALGWSLMWILFNIFGADSITTRIAVLSVAIVVLLISTCFVYIRIFLVARSLSLVRVTAQDYPVTNSKEIFRRRLKFLFNMKLAKTYSLVVSGVLVFYVPQLVVFVLRLGETVSVTSDAFHFAGIWSTNNVFINSTVNCVIFFWKNSQLRQEGKRVLKLLSRKL